MPPTMPDEPSAHHAWAKSTELRGCRKTRIGVAPSRPAGVMIGDPPPATAPKSASTLIVDHVAPLAQVTHELKAPLTAIRGALELICSGSLGAVPEAAVGLLAIARTSSDRLLQLIDDCLTVEILAAGQVSPRWELVDVDDMLREAIQTNAGLTHEAKNRFVLGPSVPGLLIRTDRRRLQQVLTNLLSNATKYAPPGSPVRLSVHRTRARIRISVRDKGPGIPAWFHPMVFQRFARAPETASVPGTGLGLHIAHGLTELLGGTIGFRCPPDGGTVFRVVLPLADVSSH